ncbi:hypothetical protein ACVBIL_06180 [Shewanella sp. 125m-7]
MQIDNPAQQLHTLLEKGRKIPATALTRTALSQLLNVENNEILLLHRVPSFFSLTEKIIQALNDIGAFDNVTVNHWSSQMNNAMKKVHMNAQWSNTIGLIDQHSMNYIKGHAQLLNAHSSIKEVPAEKLSDTKEALQGLVNQIQESDFELNIKEFLVRSLNTVINHIDEYFLTGYVPIIESLNSIYGKAVIDTDFREAVNKSDLRQDIWSTLANASSVITIGTGLPQLASSVAFLLDNLTK